MIALKTLAAIAGLAFGAALPELPTMDEVEETISLEEARKRIAESLEKARGMRPERGWGCHEPYLDGAKIEGRWFSTTKDVKSASGEQLGVITTTAGSIAFKLKEDGGAMLLAVSKDVPGGRVITVTDCFGKKLGEIVETHRGGYGERSYEIKPEDGLGGGTGVIEFGQDEYIVSGPSGRAVAKVSDGEINLLDTAGPGQNLIFMLVAAVEDADWREAARRRRENPREPGGRHL